ncbi:MAG: outer membrane protein transport protein, partial [Duodenibacillus sp.]|nr:outer membrane protein transport protein [Duodenibacillus sp.]
MKNSTIKLTAAAVLVAGSISAAQAGGFQLMEQSVAGLGRAYAGAGVVGDDLSAVWYNPAGMTLLPGTQFQFGGAFAALDLPVKDNAGNTDNGR